MSYKGRSVGYPPSYPQTYCVSFSKAARILELAVKGCQVRVTIQKNLWIQLVHLHVQDMIVILEEGNCPHPHCPGCNTFSYGKT